jgi:hypothetical protein
MSECNMNIEKCLECPLSSIVEKMNIGTNQFQQLVPCKLMCKVSLKYIEITECIKNHQGCPTV